MIYNMTAPGRWLMLLLLTVMMLAAGQARAIPVTIRLSKLQPVLEPIKLRNAATEYQLFLPISNREQLKSVLLHLEATNSISLLKERSQLAVQVNGRVVAQVPLSAQQPELRADMRIPVEWLKPGYNRLTFVVAQHYTLQCEDPAAPELWTEVNADTSTITIDSELKQLAPKLSQLPELFDPKQWAPHLLNIVTTRAPAEQHLAWGALLAQGAALQLQYVLNDIHQVVANSPGALAAMESADLMVVGTRDELGNLVPADMQGQITDAFLAVLPNPGNAQHFMLIASGVNAEQVTRAVKAFALMQAPFPDSTFMRVSALTPPTLRRYQGHNSISENTSVSFKQLGFSSQMGRGIYPEPFKLEFDLPPDIYSEEEAKVELHLHYAYGAAMRKDSVINVMVNGRFESAIPLSESTGASFHDWTLDIPLRSFRNGHNVVSFIGSLVPSVSGECQIVQINNLVLSLFDDSWIHFPKASHYIVMPDMELTARTGFPYTAETSGSDLRMYFAGLDGDTVAAGWMLSAKLAQRMQYPLLDAEYTAQMPGNDRHLVVVGTPQHIGMDLFKGAPIAVAGQINAHLPTRLGVDMAANQNWYQRLGGWFSSAVSNASEPAVAADWTLQASLGAQLLMMQYPAPSGHDHVVTTVMADTPAILRNGTAALTEPAQWDALRGDIVIWKEGMDPVYSERLGKTFLLGSIDTSDRLTYWISGHPWLGGLLGFLTLLALGVVISVMLHRFRQRHHRGVKED